jgi:hypothetical protein
MSRTQQSEDVYDKLGPASPLLHGHQAAAAAPDPHVGQLFQPGPADLGDGPAMAAGGVPGRGHRA